MRFFKKKKSFAERYIIYQEERYEKWDNAIKELNEIMPENPTEEQKRRKKVCEYILRCLYE